MDTDVQSKIEALPPLHQAGNRRVLAVSDIVEPQLYNSGVAEWLDPIDMIISCGDLPASYLDFLITALNAPCYHVIGNHCAGPHGPSGSDHCPPEAYPGVVDLDRRVRNVDGLLLAG